jgi:hypothetical protein
MPTKRRYTPLQYPKNTSEVVADENYRRLRRLYRRKFGKKPKFKSSSTDPLVRKVEFQAAMGMGHELTRKLLAQEPEFHNEAGRPKGSKDKARRVTNELVSPAAMAKRRYRAKRRMDK